ncbi:ligand-binding SRPBCC domain-containing protein [Nonlabens dokdonensis]|uniref:Cell division inhibitor SULA n=2 Tax=Nonlabens dokdonensis TaxID=328515 RepID=L7W205_NONDD|nr:SRPBCC family protein [Nonlabens dokdonensis]AGC75530.1 cell division inhibitor SULA [Nonlabens dokdonensis DSW-6]PZX43225.1 ligand-binding SRPBCC domain-containing protein [Nonlabens dokdonensis]
MPQINLETIINAPIEVVFDLARSIDLHILSLEHTNERAVAGRTSGLVKKGETVTWRAKHLGVTQELTSLITDVEPYHYFADELVKGAFKHFKHEHFFETQRDGSTLMKDIFDYTSPLGILGKLADVLFLEKYMTRLLEQRNHTLKQVAEDGRWKELPEMQPSR